MYFKNVRNLHELRKQYKDLLKKFHPDNPAGSTEATQQINLEYETLFEKLKNVSYSAECGETEKKEEYDFGKDSILRDILYRIITMEGINIEIVGIWIWVDGDTYKYKDRLKEYGFQWSKNRKKWHWSPCAGFYTKRRKKLDFDDIRNIYGSEKVQARKATAIA